MIVCARSVQYKMFISWIKFNHNTYTLIFGIMRSKIIYL